MSREVVPAPAAARRLPCLCANPDRITLADGAFAPGAGQSDAMLKAEAAERGAAPDSVLTRFARRGLSLAM